MTSESSHSRLLERGLWCLGLASLGYCGAAFLDAWVQQAAQGRRLEQARQQWASEAPEVSPPAPGGLVGRLEIPRLESSAMVLEGADDDTLRVAIGHLPGTAHPGQPGNVVLAAHRDTFFRSLGEIEAGDRINLTTPRARHRYRVVETLVVNPNNAEVLRVTARPTLTLVTCYPFHLVGPAPQRFVVRAVETAPE